MTKYIDLDKLELPKSKDIDGMVAKFGRGSTDVALGCGFNECLSEVNYALKQAEVEFEELDESKVSTIINQTSLPLRGEKLTIEWGLTKEQCDILSRAICQKFEVRKVKDES